MGQADRYRLSRFFLELQMLIEAGVPLVRSVDLLARHEPESSPLRVALDDVGRRLDGGAPLSAALSAHPTCFDSLWCRLVEVGEQGRLTQALGHVGRTSARALELRRKLFAAAAYPMLVIAVSAVLTFALLRWVLPPGGGVPAGARLPLLALPLFAAVRLVHTPWLLAAATGLVAYLSVRAWRDGAACAERIERWLWRVPMLARLVSLNGQLQLCRTLAAQLRCGVGIVDALRLSASACTVSAWSRHVQRATEAMAQGRPLHDALRQGAPSHSTVMLAMVAMGESAGDLAGAFDKGASLLEHDLDLTLDVTARLVEPALILLAAGFTIVLLISSVLPIYQTIETF